MIFFVTGTDTSVGKTVVSSALLSAARHLGWTTRGIKPVESGCVELDGRLIAEDAIRLGRAAGHGADVISSYRRPLAPDHAAREERQPPPNLTRIVEHVRSSTARLTIVEGAGGLLVPLTGDKLVIDLAANLAAPVIIVGRDGLGTINHTALTIEAARRRNLEVASFIFSATGQVDAGRAKTNATAISAMTHCHFGGRLPHLDPDDSNQLAVAGLQLPFFRMLTTQH